MPANRRSKALPSPAPLCPAHGPPTVSPALPHHLAFAKLAQEKMQSTRKPIRKPDLSALEASATEVAALLRALGNERRLLLLCLLIEQGEMAAGDLADAVALSPSATSQHLTKMRDEGLVTSRREAQTIHYRIADPRITRVVALLRDLYCS